MNCSRATLTIIGLAAVSAATLGVAPGASAATDPIVIAYEGPLTGSQASNGVDMYRGVKLAVDQVNEAGGILGRRVKLIKADDRADPSIAVQVATDVAKAGAVAVIGPYNSSVGIANLPTYLAKKVVPVQMTSSDDTTGEGVTVQPKNSQISPVEVDYILGQGATRVAMLVDPSAYTQGMADRTNQALSEQGVVVTSTPITEGLSDYSAQVAQALSTSPDLVYVSTYYPEGSKIAQALVAAKSPAQCFMGLANVDPAFVTAAGLDVARSCHYSGVPEAAQLPTAKRYVAQYRKAFKAAPGVWGTFTYDSANILFAAMKKTGTTGYANVLKALAHTKGYAGQTGTITIDPRTGNRTNVPVSILTVGKSGRFVIAD